MAGIAVLAVLASAALSVRSTVRSASPHRTQVSAAKPLNYLQLPMIFEPNQGQTSERVKYLARGHGYGLFLTADEAILSLRRLKASSGVPGSAILHMRLKGSSQNASLSPVDPLPGKSNYYIGNDGSKWHTGIPQFARVRYASVYPGIDLVYYGKQQQLEYDFEVAPNADPSQIELEFRGTRKLKLAGNGDLMLATGSGDVRLEAPRVYQTLAGRQQSVAGHFVLKGDHSAGFALGDYDRSRTLVIDPVFSYSSYLGGSGDEACSAITQSTLPQSGCPAVTVDSAFFTYIAGTTTSPDFPHAINTINGSTDVFVIKFDPTAAIVQYSTYLGGSSTEFSAGIAVDNGCKAVNGICAYVTGVTNSNTDFPVPNSNALQPPPVSAGSHAFVSQFGPTGLLLYSTYLASTGTETGTGIAVDFKDQVHVTGTTSCPTAPTTSCNYPVTAGTLQNAPKAINQFFYTELNPAAVSGAASLLYSTYIGGSNPANGVTLGGGIAVDQTSTPAVYITGGTNFVDMPVLNAALGTEAGGNDAWAAKLIPANPTGSQLVYLTYIGGSQDEQGNGIAVDSSTNAYIVGTTNSPDVTLKMPLPAGTAPFQPCLNDPTLILVPPNCPTLAATDAFVAKLGVICTGTTCTSPNVPLNYFSYLGGTDNEVGLAIAVDTNQGARLTGATSSGDLPVTMNAPQPSSGGARDAFAARIDTTAVSSGSPGHVVTYLGGSNNDAGTGIAVDSLETTYVVGETLSNNFPKLNPFQGSLDGTSDAFLTKLNPEVNLSIVGTASPATDSVGTEITYTFTITNVGDLTTGVVFTDFLPTSGATFNGASPSTCGGAVGTPPTVTCALGTLNSGATSTVTIKLTPTVANILTNTGQVSVTTGSSFTASASISVQVFDFDFTISPATQTVKAGVPATYTVKVTPTGVPFPGNIAPSCGTPLPTGATCTFTPTSITNLDNGAASLTLVVNTTARPNNTGSLFRSGVSYATWLPVSGLALLGVGIGGTVSRRRRWLGALFLGVLFAFIGLQAGCGGSSSAVITTGTPVGTYQINVTVTSGNASHPHSTQLVVQ